MIGGRVLDALAVLIDEDARLPARHEFMIGAFGLRQPYRQILPLSVGQW